MSSVSCELARVLASILGVFQILMIAYAVVSWVPSLRGRWSDYVAWVVEPVLMPVRRVIPPVGGLDLSFLVVLLVVQWVIRWMPASACAPTFGY